MAPALGQRPVYASAGWEIDLARRELRSRGVPVPLGGRAFEIVAELARSGGELVTKSDLTKRVWPRTFIDEGALRVHIAAIRKAFGPDRDMLMTTVGRGYRLRGNWEVRHEGAAGDPPAVKPMLARAEPLSTNLPAARFDLIGRASAVAYVRELLSAYRVVTLTGPGGIGKTALALEVARSLLPTLQGDCVLVELASLSSPELVPSAVAGVLGLKLDGEEISSASVARATATRECLLVLDNCEHVVDAVAELTEAIVTRCPRITVLATSREFLRIDGEQVYRVPPLDVPPETQVEPGDALGHAAVELFIARAAALGAGFQADKENFAAIVSICRRLDGIPLAIEFAAARTVMLRPPEIAALLDDRFKFLTTGRRTALPRHQTLRATLDWSYDLLPESEARVLRQLAVFAGDFPLDAALAVAEDLAAASADYLSHLVAKSLVVVDLRSGIPHYRLLDTTRAYALEKLRNSGEYRQAARRLAEYYRDFFAQAEAESEQKSQAEWLAIYGRHIDNVRASLDWAFGPDGDPPIGVALTVSAVPIWVQLSLLGECRERAELALARLEGDMAVTTRPRMQLSAALAWSLMYGVGRVWEAGPAWATTLQLADHLDDRDYRQRALWGLCIDQFNNGEFRKALEFANRFADAVAKSTDAVDLVMADRLLATTQHYLGDQNAARHHIDRVLAHLADLTLKPGIVRFRFDLRVSTHYFQARILWLQGFADQALRAVEHNIEEGRVSGHALTFCSVLGQGACPIIFLAGNLDAAEDYCAALLDHTQRHPIRLWHVWARCFKGILMVKRGDVAAGVAVLRRELESAGEARFLPRFLLPLGELAACLGEAGEVAHGIATVDETLTRCEARDERWYLAELKRIKGVLLLQEGEHRTEHPSVAAAEQCFGEALEIARRQGALFWELRTAASLARLRIMQDRRADARGVLAPVYEKFSEGFEIADMRDAKALLDSL